MSTKIYPNGSSGEVALAANDKIAVFSNSAYEVYQLVGYPNLPSTWNLIKSGAAGETYTSAAFSAAATVRVDAGPSEAFYEVGTAPVVAEPMTDQEFADAAGVIAGLAAAQGGSSQFKGGTSSTAGNAGGAALLTGGQPGATGVGGAATVAGGAGGATSGAGGVASITGGAGTNGNAAGGVGKTGGGAGQGTGAGGAAQLIGGASGSGATGNGGAATIAGGAAASTNGNGGSVILTGGALAGSGVAGMVIERSVKLVAQGAATAKTVSATLTAAEVLAGIITVNQAAGGTSAQQLPTASAMDTAMPDAAAGDAFDFSVINTSTVDAEDASVTTNTGWTLVGNMDIHAYSAAGSLNSSARFRARKTGSAAWTLYRIS